jgi:hypothetical protein
MSMTNYQKSNTEHSGLVTEYGIEIDNRPKPPFWQRRRIIAMNVVHSVKNNKDIGEWEIFLDCGHSIRETYPYLDSPKGMYRDCSPRKHQ